MSIIKDVIRDTSAITKRAVDQEIGMYDSEKPCCVGALLAGFFGVDEGESWDYIRGAIAFANVLGGNVAQVSAMLTYAGAGDYPFSKANWPNTPEEVWKKLAEVEEFPSIARCEFDANVEGYNFNGQSFIDLDLTDTVFRNLQIKDVTFHKSNLKETEFRDCELHRTKWIGARLDGVIFSGSVLHDANFRGATIINCDFVTSDISGAYFDDEQLKEESNMGLERARMNSPIFQFTTSRK